MKLALGCLCVVSALSVSTVGAAQSPDAQPPDAQPPDAQPPDAQPPDVQPPDAPPKGLVPPELTELVEAPYPPEAAGEEADVELELDIDAEGKVTDARVVASAGEAFDTAALAAARQFRFEPARRDGEAIPSRIRYVYQFRIEPSPEPVEDVDEPPGELTGELRFGADTPLGGAEITLRGQGETRTIRTDPQGRFRFGELPPGTYRVQVVADGFETYASVERIEANTATDVVLRLRIAAGLDEVVIQGERSPTRPVREVTRRSLSRREISRIPGTNGDALRSVQSLPGVARPPALAGLLIVRGSAPQDSGIFVDQTTVPLIYHFGGLSSVIPTEMLERIDFYPSNFGVRYGRLQGGIVDVTLRSPDTSCQKNGEDTGDDDCFHGMGQLDLIDGRIMASGPLTDDWSFALAARRSWVDAWVGAVLGSDTTSVTAAPVYYDYQAIVEYRPTDRDRLSLRVYGSDDQTKLLFDEPPQPGLGGTLALSTRFIRAQALFETTLTDDVFLTGMLSGGWEAQNFSAGNNLTFDLDSFPLEYRAEIGWQATEWLRWNTGLDYQVTPIDFSIRAPSPPRPGEPEGNTLVDAPTFETNPRGTLHRPAAFTEVDLSLFDRWKIVPGVRLDHTRNGSSLAVSPRLYSRYRLFGPDLSDTGGPWRPRTTLKGGIGVFHQPPQVQEVDEVFGTPGLGDQRAIHASGGVEQEVTEQVEVSAEGFYKDLQNLVARAPSATGAFDYANEGRGKIYGGELMVKYKPDDFFFGWVAYSLSRSVRQDAPDAPERPFQFDQTHNLTVLGSFRLPWGIEAGARFRLISGSPYTPVSQRPAAVLATDGSEYIPVRGEPFSERLPLFHQLDIRVDKKWQFEDWRFSAYLDVQNIYNRRAAEGISYNFDYTQLQFSQGLPILPSLGLRGEF